MRVYASCARLVVAALLLCGGISLARAQGVDEDGNPIVYRETFELQGGETTTETGVWPLPAGWTTENVVPMSNGAHQTWQRRKGGSFTNYGDPLTFYPRKAGEGIHNAAFAANDAKAQAYLISPPYDLRPDKVASPALTFLYASLQRAEADELRLRYRLSPEGAWKDVKDATGQVMVWKRQEIWQRQVVNLKEVLERDGVAGAQWGSVQLAFWGFLHRGYGVCIDDVKIVDLANKRVEVHSASYQTLGGPVGEGTQLNEAALLSLNVSPGAGYFRLRSFGAKFVGDNVDDVEKVQLYRTSAPYFSAKESDRLCELKLVGGAVQSLEWDPSTEAVRNKFASGWHYFWIVVDIKKDAGDNARLKRKVAFQLPKDAVSFDFCNGPTPLENDYKYPAALTPAGGYLSLTIYKTLYRTSFETADDLTKWTLEQNGNEGGWHIGELAASQPDPYLTPRSAFSGNKVLATSRVVEGDKLRGYVEQNQVRRAMLRDAITTKNFSDVRMKVRYSLGLDPKAEAAVLIKPENGDWVEAWTAKNRTTSNAWNLLSLTLTDYTARKNSVEVGFHMKSEDVNEAGHWGAFFDEVQVLGDYVRKDVGVSRIEAPSGFDFNSTTPIRIHVKNYGAEVVPGPVEVHVTLSNGSGGVVSVPGPINPDQEVHLDVTGLEMTPSLTGDNTITVTAVSKLEQDDDATNNGSTVTFYAFPTFEVSHVNPYPKDVTQRMSHWYATPMAPKPSHSWLRSHFNELEGAKRDAFKNPPYSAYVWTTGKATCLKDEHSVLTGPVLNLVGSEGKQLVVTYALQGGKLRFEYRTSSGAWQRLEKSAALYSLGWYEADGAWDGATATPGYVTAKVQLPEALNGAKVQFRAVFEHTGAGVLGAAINQVQVRALQPDFVVEFDPLSLTNPTAEVNANGYVKFKIKNQGQAISKAFNCPVEISVYDHKLNAGVLPPDNYDDLNSLAALEAMGTLNLHRKVNFSHSVGAIPLNGAEEVDPAGNHRVSALWNYPATYYVVRIRIFPERVNGVVDEDQTNNEIIRVVMPYKMPHSVLKNVHAIYKTMYVATSPVPSAHLVIQDWHGRQLLQQGGVRYPRLAWTPVRSLFIEKFELGSGIVSPQSTQDFPVHPTWAGTAPMLARYAETGKIKLKVHATRFTTSNKFDQGSPASTPTEPKSVVSYDEEITIKLDRSKAAAKWIRFSNQVGGGQVADEREITYGCYNKDGESLTVRIEAKDGSVAAGTVHLKIFANGTQVEGSPFAINQPIVAGGSIELPLSGVKLPAGYSRIDAWVEGVSESEATSQPTTIAYQVYRWEAPNPMTVLVRNTNDPQDFYQLPHNGTEYDNVPYYGTKTLELFVVPTERVSYQWYKGSVDAPLPLPEPVGTQSVVQLEEESASYQLSYKMEGGSACEGRTGRIVVRADDLALLNFAGPEGSPGICPDADGKGKLSVVIYNNSRTVYPVGTKLSFEFTRPGMPTEQLPAKELAKPLEGHSTVEIELGNLEGLVLGKKEYKLKLIGINGKPDGNPKNDVLEQEVMVYKRPSVQFTDPKVDPYVIRQLFTNNSTYNLSPISSPDVVSYVWHYKEDYDGEEQKLNHTGRTYDIDGIPHDVYRVVVSNESGCTDDASVRFIQTDFGVTGIVSPKSDCKLELNEENAVVNLRNFGSKILKVGTKAKIQFWVDSEMLAEETLELKEALEPSEELRYTLATPTLKDKLKGKESVTIKAVAKLEGLEDLDASNNERPLLLKAHGYPTIEVQMSKTPDGPIDLLVAEGSRHVIYDALRKFDVQGDGAVKYSWDFRSDAQAPPRQVATQAQPALPTDLSKQLSNDKRGSGFYQAVTENAHVCQTRLQFELVFETIDIGFAAKVQAPDDACSFDSDMELRVQLVNNSSVPIPRRAEGATEDMQLKLTVVDRDVNDLTVEKIESVITLEQDWPAGGKIDHTITIPKANLSPSLDEVVYNFVTTLSFVDAKWEGYDRVRENNVDECEVVDKADVKLNGIHVKGKKVGEEAVWTDAVNLVAFTYDPLMPDDSANQVTLEAQVVEPVGSPYIYTWEFDPSLLLDKTEGGVAGKKRGVFEGGGEITLTVSSAQGGCSRSIKGTIQGNVADIAISKVNAPTSTCLDKYDPTTGLPVSLVIQNMGSNTFALPPSGSEDPKLKLTYNVYREKEGGGEEQVNTEPYENTIALRTKDAQGVEIVSNALTQTGHKSQHSLSSLVPLTRLPGKGKYIVKFSFYLTGVVDGNTHNNTKEYAFEIYGAPELDFSAPGMVGWEHQKFYRESAEIGVNNTEELNKYTNFSWRRLPSESATFDTPGGIDYTTPHGLGKSFIAVADPGTYMLRFENKKGCVGYARKKVEFPGYIELVENKAFASPTNSCALTAAEKVALRIQNKGKQTYTKRTVPIEVELKNPTGGNPTTKRLNLPMPSDLAPGEEMVLRSDEVFDLSGVYDYQLEAVIGIDDPEREAAQAAGLADEHRRERADVSHYYTPAVPKVSDLARAQLDKIEPGLHLDRIPRVRGGQPVVFVLDGLVPEPEMVLSPSQAEGLQFEWTAGSWTDNKEPKTSVTKFNATGVYKVRVGIEYGHGEDKITCWAESDEVSLAYASSYTLATATDLIAGQCLKDEDKKPVQVKATISLPEADEPLQSGSALTLVYGVSRDPGGSPIQPGVEETYTLTESMKPGDSFAYSFDKKPELGPGRYYVNVSAVYTDKFGEKFASPASSVEVAVPRVPVFKFEEALIETSNSPYTLSAPALPEGEEYTYSWNSGEFTTRSIDVRESRTYELTVTTAAQCTWTEVVAVRFVVPINWTVRGEGEVSFGLLGASGNVERQLANGDAVPVNSRLKVIAKPSSGYEVNSVLVNKLRQTFKREGYEGIHDVVERTDFDISFRVKTDPNITDVSSELLSDARVLTPFDGMLVIFGATDVVRYELVSQTGTVVLAGSNSAGAERIDAVAAHLAEGFYLVRLYGRDGSLRTLRTLRVR